MKINFNFFKSKVVKDSMIYTFSDVVNMSIPFLLLPILTKYLSPEDYGSLNVFTSFVAGLSIIITLKVESAVNVNFYKLPKNELSIYIGNTILISLISLSILLFKRF